MKSQKLILALSAMSVISIQAVPSAKDAAKPASNIMQHDWGMITKETKETIQLPTSDEAVVYTMRFKGVNNGEAFQLQLVNKTPKLSTMREIHMYRKFKDDHAFHSIGHIVTTDRVSKLGKYKDGELHIRLLPNGVMIMPDLQQPGKDIWMHLAQEQEIQGHMVKKLTTKPGALADLKAQHVAKVAQVRKDTAAQNRAAAQQYAASRPVMATAPIMAAPAIETSAQRVARVRAKAAADERALVKQAA